MSIYVMTHVWRTSNQSLGSLLVLLALADYSNDDGVSWPTIKSLTQKARLSETQVHRVLRELQDAGELEIQSAAGPHGTNLYRVVVAPPSKLAPPELAPGGVPSAKAEGVQRMAPEPLLEPSEDQPSEELEATTAAVDGSGLIRALARGHEAVIGMLTPYVGQQFAMFATEYPLFPVAWIADAFARAGDNNVRKWSYVKAILEGWAAKGRDDAPAKRQERDAVPLSAYPKHQCGPICRKQGCVMTVAFE